MRLLNLANLSHIDNALRRNLRRPAAGFRVVPGVLVAEAALKKPEHRRGLGQTRSGFPSHPAPLPPAGCKSIITPVQVAPRRKGVPLKGGRT